MRRAGIVLATALLAAACGGKHASAPGVEQPAPAEVAVETALAAPEATPVLREATGTVLPWARVAPGTKIVGRVLEVRVREGDRVSRGQVLARLERRDLEAAVDQAQASVVMAEARLDNARAQRERMAGLHARGSVTTKSFEDADAALRVGEAALSAARADLEAAKVTLDYADVRSPVEGWVTERLVEVGDMASPTTPLFRIDELSRVKVALTVPEADAAVLGVGDAVRVRVDGLEAEWEATVDRLVPAGDAASRTFEAQLVLPNPEARLKAGMFARASFSRGGETREALLVPESAVVRRGQLEGLFVTDEGGRARLRWVRLGRAVQGRVEVLSGLSAGERYVVAPGAGFADGTPVEG